MVAFFKKKRKTRVLMVAMLIVTLVATYGMPMSVFATVAPTGSAGQIVTNGQESSFDSGAVKISKTIAGTANENEFDINLKVVTTGEVTTNKVNAVIVIDTSGSMADNGRLTKAKEAAKTFVNTVLPKSSGNTNKVGLVEFYDGIGVVQDLTNNKNTINGKIDNLEEGGGTFIQAGIIKAQQMLNGSNADAGAKKYIILLSDGAPTYSYTAHKAVFSDEIKQVSGVIPPNYKITEFKDQVYGNGSQYNFYNQYELNINGTKVKVKDHGVPTISQAILTKNAGIEIYSIGCDLQDQYIYRDLVATKAQAQFTLSNCASGSDHYKDVTADDLKTTFENIGKKIVETKAGIVTDPMGNYINFNGFVNNTANVSTYNAANKSFDWDLTKSTYVKNGSTYTYSLKYKIILDTDADGFTANTPYATNGTTSLTYSKNNIENTVNFIVPTVKGQLPKFDVTVKYFEVSADGTERTYIGADKDQTLLSTVKGTTFASAVTDPIRNQWYDQGALLATDYNEGVIVNPTNTVSNTNKVIEVEYRAIAKSPYVVNYYVDSVSGNPIATTTSALSYVSGTSIDTIGDLATAYLPNNTYQVKSISVDTDNPLIINTQGSNVINVVYEQKATYSYTVEYYIDNVKNDAYTTTSAVTYYAGDEINSVDQTKGKPSGYTVDSIAWGAGSTSPLTISSDTANNVIKVYYVPADGISYKVEHYKQNDDGSYSSIATDTDTTSGKTGVTVLAGSFIKSTTATTDSYYGYSYNEFAEGAVTSAAIQGNGATVLKLYYDQVKAPLVVRHIYDGVEDQDKTITKSVRIGSPIFAGQSRVYGFVLDTITVNGETLEAGTTSYTDTMIDDVELGVVIEFNYKKVDSAIQITRHYENLTTGTTGEAIEDIETTTSAINLIEDAKREFGGLTYNLVRVTIQSDVIENIRIELSAAIDEFKASLDNVKKAYNEVVNALTDGEKAAAQQAYDDAISPTAISLKNAQADLETTKAALGIIREAASADEKDTLDSAQSAYDSAVRTLTTAGIEITSSEALTITYDEIIQKYDDAIDAAEAAIDTAKGADEYKAAVQAIIDADPAVVEAQAAYDVAKGKLDAATEPVFSGNPEDQESYDLAKAAYDELVKAEADAKDVLEAAKAAVDTSGATTDALVAAEEALDLILKQKGEFMEAENALLEKAALASAETEYDSAKTAAWNQYEADLKASDEYKAEQKAQEEHDAAVKKAQEDFDKQIRAVVRAKNADLVTELEAAEAALKAAEKDLQDALDRAGLEECNLQDAEVISLLSNYEFTTDMDYAIDVYYEYKAPETNPENPSNPSNPGGGSGGGGGGSNNPVIRDDEIPASPIVVEDEVTPAAPIDDQIILDDQVPAGPLPKTGGIPGLLLYGFGALLAGGGLVLRRKENNNK